VDAGATCTTCFTLNPAGAPACVRCNSPLGGLAATPKGTPGSSRDQAAAVQPPGYGLTDEPDPEPGPAPAPPGMATRVAVLGVVVVLAVLIVGGATVWLSRGRYLDEANVERTIAGQLAERGNGAVTVDCPPIRISPGRPTGCTATDAAGGRRTVTVTVLDDAGRYRWELDR
jgi:hypothetical protein